MPIIVTATVLFFELERVVVSVRPLALNTISYARAGWFIACFYNINMSVLTFGLRMHGFTTRKTMAMSQLATIMHE